MEDEKEDDGEHNRQAHSSFSNVASERSPDEEEEQTGSGEHCFTVPFYI